MTQVETERAPESNASEIADPPELHTACDGLARLAKRFPKEVAQILDVDDDDQTGDVCCKIYETLNRAMAKNGFACIADVAELCERWEKIETGKRNARATLKAMQPFLEKHDDSPAATLDLDDIRKRVTQIAGLVEAAYLCEGSITHGSGDKDAITDYFTAISGSISVAASECRELLADVNGKGGAS